ncbi:MAG: hypothetical protein AAB547_00030 [Patescibacteria group bacterium]
MDLQESLQREAIRLRAQAQEKVDAARVPGTGGDRAAETQKPEVPIAELLAQVASAAAAQAEKFMAPVVENVDQQPPVEPVSAGVEKPVAVEPKQTISGRRRRRGRGKDGTPKPHIVDVKSAVVVETPPVPIIVQAVPPDNKDADEGHRVNPFAPRKIVESDGDAPASVQEKPVPPVAAAQVVMPENISNAAEITPEPAIVVPERPKGETVDLEIVRLKNEVDELRAGYVKADYDETNAWARVKNFFGKSFSPGGEREWQEKQYNKKGNYSDGVYWQAQYQNKLVDLKNAQLASVRQRAGDGVGWKKEMADMIRYFDLDEPVNLIEARTEYRAGKQNWPTKVLDSFGALGRRYNELSMKEKLAITAVCAGGALALALSGGAATGTLAGVLVGVRKALGVAGMSVGTEALLDSSRAKHRIKETEKEIERLFTETPEGGFMHLDAEMKKKVFATDEKLQNAKLTKLLHKTGALSVGAFVGSGWLTEIAMNQWGGNEAVDWVKERFGEMVSGSDTAAVPETITASDTPSLPHSTAETAGAAVDTGVETAAEQAPVPPIAPDTEAGVIQPDAIGSFVNQDTVVQKGDSVWKISGRLADQLGLEGAQRTHFVNAIKNQFGDVLLQEGETINFAEHGINQDFVEKALGQANALSPEQMASISVNDAKLATYSQANPDITLTNEVADNILQAETADAASADADSGIPAATGTPGNTFGQEMIAPRGILPEMMALYGERADDWYAQIFRMENASFGQDWLIDKEAIGKVRLRDILADARLFQQGAFSGHTTGLDREQIANFAEFFQGVSKNDIGFDRLAFFKENPNATVMDYLNEVAPLVNPGQRIGLYTTTK